MKKRGKILLILFGILFAVYGGIYIYTYFTMPENYYIFDGEDTVVANDLMLVKGEVPSETSSEENKKVQMNLFGIPVKSVNVSVIDIDEVVACGVPFGIKMYTNGVMVVSMTDVDTQSGSLNPAYEAGIRIKDIITKVNSKTISSVEQLEEIVAQSGGNTLQLTVVRDGKEIIYGVTPVKSVSADKYRLGLWIRDSSAGIGTMTYYDKKTGLFAGLGHGICDVDTGQRLPLSYGTVLKSSIIDIVKGEKGSPGELKGILYDNMSIGQLYDNSDYGVFGILTDDGMNLIKGRSYPVALSSEIEKGPAKILCTLDDDKVKEYDIIIENINRNPYFGEKNMVIKITDKDLISKTGGIVQGMSGSPIIQNGKLVGAVTHVFISDPAKGYGIFAENMIKNSYEKLNNKKVS